jgi:hypothetical protein
MTNLVKFTFREREGSQHQRVFELIDERIIRAEEYAVSADATDELGDILWFFESQPE